MEYRYSELLARDDEDGSLVNVPAADYKALQPLPRFMIQWGQDAAPTYGSDRIITSTINASNGCEIGDKALCGQFCFSHLSWQGDAPKSDIPALYALDSKKLKENNLSVSVFLSTDTEPLPGPASKVTTITRRLLLEMIQQPPKDLILHTHTDTSASDDILPILKDLSEKTNLLIGIGFETDTEDLPNGLPPPFTSISNRLRAIEVLSANGIKTQAAVAPLVGFRDFHTFGSLFKNIGTYRVMVGDLRLDFDIGGTAKAKTLKERLGLPAPTQEEAKAFFEAEGFAPERVAFRDQFYVVVPDICKKVLGADIVRPVAVSL